MIRHKDRRININIKTKSNCIVMISCASCVDANAFLIDWNLVYNTVSYSTVIYGYCPMVGMSLMMQTLGDCCAWLASTLIFGDEFQPHWSQIVFLAALSASLSGPRDKKPRLVFKNTNANAQLYIEFDIGKPNFWFGVSVDGGPWKKDGYDLRRALIFHE